METFKRLESEVRSYCRSFPAVFVRAAGARLWDEQGRSYLDFFCGVSLALRPRGLEYKVQFPG